MDNPQVKNWTAVTLQVRRWKLRLAELQVTQEQLDLRIDGYEGGPNDDLNRLVGRFIDVKYEADELQSDIDRVTGNGRITR